MRSGQKQYAIFRRGATFLFKCSKTQKKKSEEEQHLFLLLNDIGSKGLPFLEAVRQQAGTRGKNMSHWLIACTWLACFTNAYTFCEYAMATHLQYLTNYGNSTVSIKRKPRFHD